MCYPRRDLLILDACSFGNTYTLLFFGLCKMLAAPHGSSVARVAIFVCPLALSSVVGWHLSQGGMAAIQDRWD